MTYEDMREEFYYLKDENINNLDTKDLPNERWFPIYYNEEWFVTEISNLGRFRIGSLMIKRMPDPVPFGLITIKYKEIKDPKDKNKNYLFIHAIDVMRSCREYYGDEMFDIITSNGTVVDGTTCSESTHVTDNEDVVTVTEQQSIKEDVNDILVFNNDGDLIREYSSLKECAKELNAPYTTVLNSIFRNTHLYYKYRIFRRSELNGKAKIEQKYSSEIRLYDPAGHFVEEFANSEEVLNKFKMSNTGNINKFCTKRMFSRECNGYLRWKKEVGNAEIIEIPNTTKNNSKIIVLDKDNNKVQGFKTGRDVAKYMNLCESEITRAAKGKNNHYYHGYYFYRENEYLKKFIYKEED